MAVAIEMDFKGATLEQYDEVWAAGGIAHSVFPSTFAELVQVTGGEPADVA